MTDKTMWWKLALVAGLVAILMWCSGLIVARHYDSLDASSHDVTELRRAYENMRSGSDILSLHVMRYVMTGAPAERDAYFRESKRARHREEAFRILAHVHGSTTVESHLRTAMNLSMELMQMEYHAMRMMVKDEEDLRTSPPEIQGCRLTEEERRVTLEERRRRARAEIFGDGYFSFKLHIYESLDNAIKSVIQYAETRAVRGWTRMVMFNVLIGLSLLVVGCVLGRWILGRKGKTA